MSLSIYEASVPPFIRAFHNLAAILEKGAVHAAETSLDPASLIEARLAPDMLNLAGQVQRASDTAKASIGRLAGITPPSFPDTETTFPELQGRIAQTVRFLEGITAEQLAGAEDRAITMNLAKRPVTFTGRSYLLTFGLPNFYFHITAAYAILRHKGVALGKLDYLGAY